MPVDRASRRPGTSIVNNKNWRGIAKACRCPFCKQAKGKIRKGEGRILEASANCGAIDPRRRPERGVRAFHAEPLSRLFPDYGRSHNRIAPHIAIAKKGSRPKRLRPLTNICSMMIANTTPITLP
jgi:hypothetical protein